MKTCSTCLIAKPTSEFQVRKASSDGFTSSCKACLRDRDKARYEAEKPKRIAAMKRYSKTERGKVSHAASVQRWQVINQKRRAANVLLNNAVRDGRVIPWPACAMPDCESTDVEGHHPDYDQPLSVVWLCKKHHEELHAQFTQLLKSNGQSNE